MKNLFLIDGASGFGKVDLLRYAADFDISADYVRKFTTRSQREYEKRETWTLDLEFISDNEFDDYDFGSYKYRYRGEKYGFFKSELDDRLSRGANVFLIIRDVRVIRRLMDDYKFINVVPVFIYTDLDKIQKRFTQEGIHDEGLQSRLIGIARDTFEDYLRHPDIYQEVLINNASRNDYHRLIDLLLKKYHREPDVDEKLIFVLMSFNPSNSVLMDYCNAIKRAVTRYDPSFECKDLHDIKGSFKISDTAKKKIRSCRLAIVDLTDNRPNVYYELGYVHGIEKGCIITTHVESSPHFYPGEYRIVKYKNASELEERLLRELHGVLRDEHSHS